jgi:hypothetical protein
MRRGDARVERAPIRVYPVGATIAVRYDPQNLQRAVLEIGQLGAARYLFAGTLLAGVGVGALLFAIWSATLPGDGFATKPPAASG